MQYKKAIIIFLCIIVLSAVSIGEIYIHMHTKNIEDTPSERADSTPAFQEQYIASSSEVVSDKNTFLVESEILNTTSDHTTVTATSTAVQKIPPDVSITHTTTEIMGWIYPGPPACSAVNEIADGRKIDVLKAEYFAITEAGVLTMLTTAHDGCNAYSENNIALLKRYAEAQYVTVSVNYADSMERFLTNDIHTSIDTLVSFVQVHDLTGVELDFEDFGGWSDNRYALYKQFVTTLGTALHAQGKKLMIDGPAVSNKDEETWYLWRYKDFIALPVDQIVIMMYDYQFDHGVGNPVSPLAWMRDVILWTKRTYPNLDKLVIGLPSYGYRGTEGTQKMSLLTYDQIKKESGFNMATRDSLSGEMTWKNGTTRYFYQDSESLRIKRELVESLGITSISVWHLGGNQWFR